VCSINSHVGIGGILCSKSLLTGQQATQKTDRHKQHMVDDMIDPMLTMKETCTLWSWTDFDKAPLLFNRDLKQIVITT